MNIIAIRKEKTLAELAQSLFKAEAGEGRSVDRKALAALRKANPDVASTGTLAEGTPIVVPEVEGLRPNPAADRGFNLSANAADLVALLSRLTDHLENASAQRLKQEETQARELKEHARELTAAGPEVKKRVEAAQRAAKQRTKDLADEQKLNTNDLKHLKKDLDLFSKSLGG